MDDSSGSQLSKSSTVASYKPPKRLKPFKPNSFKYSLESAEKLFVRPRPPVIKNTIAPDKTFEGLVDAETGEPIFLSKAKWNVKEGRLNMDAKCILAMSTGQLDIKRRTEASSSSSHQQSKTRNKFSPKLPPLVTKSESVIISSPTRNVSDHQHHQQHQQQQQQQQRHPIVTQFLLEGPRNARFHRFWNKRTDSVDINADNIGDICEEDVDYYGCDALYKSHPSAGKDDDLHSDIQSKFMGIPHGIVDDASLSSSFGKFKKSSHGMAVRGPSLDSDTRSHVSAASYDSRVSKLSKSSDICRHVDPRLDPTNSDSWEAVEEKCFQELFTMVSAMEANKSLTREEPLKGGLMEVREKCRHLARLKTKSMKELVMAVEDEKRKDARRDQAELDILYKPEAVQDLLKRTHNEERKKARLYLTALQTDSEIQFVHRRSEAGLLW